MGFAHGPSNSLLRCQFANLNFHLQPAKPAPVSRNNKAVNAYPLFSIPSFTMEPTSGILIYAELLTNIKRVSVGVHLPSRSDATTRVVISDNGRQLHIYHQNSSQTLELPSQVITSTSATTLPIPNQGSVNLSWRLPVLPTEINGPQFSPENQAIPWTSMDAEPGSRVSCRKCGCDFVQKGAVRAWKDLPSENWAEMMEFWHCHKPHDHDHDAEDSHALESKGYGAGNAITAQVGVGFVDLTSFVFSEADCKGLTVSATARFGLPMLHSA